MRILVISQYFLPDITAASFRISDTVKILEQEGHQVCVITARPHKARAEGHHADEPSSESIRIRRCRLVGMKRGGLTSYLRHYLSFMLGSIREGLKELFRGWKPDVIWASSPPLFVGLSGRVLSVFFRCPLVIDVRDIWPDSAVAADQITADGLAYRIGRRIEKYVYANACHITCVAEPMRQYIMANTNTPVTVIYNGVPARFNGETHKASNTPNQLNSKKTVLYAGNLGRVQELDLLIQAFSELIREGHLKDWTIDFVGAGVLTNDLRNLVVQLQLHKRVLIEPPVTREVVMQKLRSSDLLFLSLLPHEALTLTIPSKVFDYMLAGKPIVGGLLGEGKEILESTGSNVCYPPGQIDDLKRALKKAAAAYSALGAVAYKNKLLVLSKYTREANVSRLMDVFDSLC
ncbi:MAG: glycosyltransferase [Planctomycetota bacterium]|jgi:glycosyltransferase involved in cell wall biosynthesis